MQTQNLLDNYCRDLGKVIGNLHSLEVMLRLFLHNVDLERYGSPPPKVSLDNIEVDEFVQESYFVNYDSLGDLVKKYNDIVTSREMSELRVDENIIKLRDAFAHGRVLGSQPSPPFTLYKFGKPSGEHQVKVERITNLSKENLAEHIRHLLGQVNGVEKACKTFCPDIIG